MNFSGGKPGEVSGLKRNSQKAGLLLFGSGVVFLLHNFRLVSLGMEYLWPLFLVITELFLISAILRTGKTPVCSFRAGSC